ncbi:hypothetical protein E2K80_15895 [Rhodophyticola sp. CCM32]|uniref:translocation/assembly module TamB domain-containing protein n=1 Tax=Rhodophyticola sp. CCM32 TaxID=2916397 RepID=UPI00107F4AC3|nr:translocation/assembly module TamB domain-containing protein [Rhodophyticola sp. CCM32]QBY02029.1 hypothetical protein E2K80_15895 [Rhodophyticola sp. CCM32]
MKRALLITMLALSPTGLGAQDDDRGRLQALLEDALSDDAARQVRIEGFRGALNSQASLDRLTIADEDGIWLTLEEVTLDWTRSALFSRALEVNELTAGRLELARLPQSDSSLPDAETTPFSLPELPLSIRIDHTAIDRVEIGAPVLGQDLAFTVEGTATLADGAADAALQLERLDGPLGRFRLTAGFENETRSAVIDMLFEEEAGGLAASLLGIPGAPSLSLSVDGQGPLTDFAAGFALETDGEPRLTGDLDIAQSDSGVQTIALDMSGDVTAIVLPQYRDFFGPDVSLIARVTQDATGVLTADPLHLETAAIALDGQVVLNAARQPESFMLIGQINPADGDRVRLPIADGAISIGDARLDVGYTRSLGNSWTGRFALTDLIASELTAETVTLDISGEITEADQGLSAVTALMSADAAGLGHTDDATASVMGETATIETFLAWQRDAPVSLMDLRVAAGDLTLTGQASADLAEARLDLSYDLAAESADLSRFAPFAGDGLAGAARLSVAGTAEALSGAFDATVTGETTGLRLAPGLPSGLFAGTTALDIAVRRNETGLVLDQLQLQNQELTVAGSGRLSSADSEILASVRFRNVGLFTSALSGPARADGRLSRETGTAPWVAEADLAGPGGTTLALNGDVGLPGGAVDLGLTGRVPLGLADRFIAPQTVRGNLALNMRMTGTPDLENMSGTLTTSGTTIAAPALGLSLAHLSANAEIANGSARLTTDGTLGSGGRVSASGSVGFSAPGLPARIDIALDEAVLIDPELYELAIPRARLTYAGDLSGSAMLSGEIGIGQSEIRVPESSLGSTEPIPDITHLHETPAQRRTRGFAGLLDRNDDSAGNSQTALDLTISAPGRIFLRGRGLDAELGGTLRVRGTTANALPDGRFDLIRGRLGILGQRLDLVEGSATLSGSFDPFIRLVAQSRVGEYLIRIILEGPASAPEVRFASEPELPQDEVLAQLFFGRSISSLSPLQALQLADAVAGLAGGGSGGGIFSNLRENLGLDDLDIQTSEDGSAALRAGRYLSDNVYTDVTVGGQEGAIVNLNIDLTPSITARGSFGAEGDSSLGLFFERDY